MAKAAVEMAAWDLCARRQAVPLSVLLGGTRVAIESGVSIGIQDSLEQLASEIEIERAAGYRRIKIKIKPGWDVERRRGGPRAVRRYAADGGRQRGVHAGRRRRTWRRSIAST